MVRAHERPDRRNSMIKTRRFALCAAAFVAALALATASFAQESAGSPAGGATGSERLDTLDRDTGGFLGRLFRRDEPAQRGDGAIVTAQVGPTDLVVRLERLENQIRQLTGVIEQLQYRNQQLEQQLRRVQEDTDYRFQELGGKAPARPAPNRATGPGQIAPAGPAPATPGRRSDVFDPNENPNAPGAPRALGGGPLVTPAPGVAGPPPVASAAPPPAVVPPAPVIDDPAAPDIVGAPGGRAAGAPLDLSTLSSQAANDSTLNTATSVPSGAASGPLPPPPPRNPSATGAQLAAAPSANPRDEYDLAYGYVLRKDYALAEESFRAFIKKHPDNALMPDANYWLGESLFQRQRYRDAAESFLAVSTNYEKSAKAPEALLRLGQSLAALKAKEQACATFTEVPRRYPRASPSVKQSAEREKQRVGC
jgi:tol-pal system protein YbgF